MMIQRNGPNASFAAHDFLQSSTVFSSAFIAEASHLSLDVFRLILARKAGIANQTLLLLRQSNSTQFFEAHSCIPLSLFRHIPSGTQKKENRHRKQRANANRFPMTTRLFDEKEALLCYAVLDRDAATELLYIITMLEVLNLSDLKKMEMLIYAYLHADASIREIVDTALKPYREDNYFNDGID